MFADQKQLGMILKGYPRISESFISSEILLLESLGLPIQIYSLRRPREDFTHESVARIRAPVTYLPEYVLPNLRTLIKSNATLWKRLGRHYRRTIGAALVRAWQRRKVATVRHFLQAGHLCATALRDPRVAHLHAHFCHTPTSVAVFAAQLSGLPFSFTAHAKDIYTSEPDQLRRKIQLARFVVTCTRYNARYLSRLAGGNTPIHTVYHGIDLNLFSFGHSSPPAPPYQILSIGRLVPKKGYDDLLNALKLLKSSGLDFQFSHIGSGEMERQIRARVQALNLENQVRLLGTLPHGEVIKHYRKAHCFVLACKVAANGDRDGIPNVLVEAMAVGVPVISTSVSAIPELIKNGVTGILVEPGEPDMLAGAIQHLLFHPENYRDQVKQARSKVEKEFDNCRCVIALHELLSRALQTP